MHEPFDTLVELEWHPNRRALRVFGLVAAIVCSAVASTLAHRAGSDAVRSILFAASLMCIVVALVRPSWLRPLYVLLTCVTFPIRWLVAWASLLVLFFLVLTPIAVAVRRLRTRVHPSPGSAWLSTRKRPERARYFRQS